MTTEIIVDLTDQNVDPIPEILGILQEGLSVLVDEIKTKSKLRVLPLTQELISLQGFLETFSLIYTSMPEEAARETIRNVIKTQIKYFNNLPSSELRTITNPLFDSENHIPVYLIESSRLVGPKIRLSKNNMKTWINVEKDFAEILTTESIIESLKAAGIVNGIETKSIQKIFKTNQYNEEVCVAKGMPAKCGVNGKVMYCVHITDLNQAPKMLEDGRVSYKEVHLFEYLNRGDKLARLIPPKPGNPGYTVTGQRILPPDVQEVALPNLKNTELSEDKQFLVVKEDCCISKQNGLIHLESSMKIDGNVAYGSGNIDSKVSVFITGDVQTDFQVRSLKDINVMGVIEGAEIVAKGVLQAKGGIQGKNSAQIEIEGNVYAKFISQANITCMGNIIVGNEILHSTIIAEGMVKLTQSPAQIIGGEIRAEMDIEADMIGSDMGVPTTIILGGKVNDLQQLLDENEKEISTQEMSLENCLQIIKNLEMQSSINSGDNEEITKAIQKANEMQNAIRERIQNLYHEQDDLQIQHEECLAHSRAVRVRKNIWPGTKIVIANKKLEIKESIGPSTVVLSGEEITLLPYSKQ